MNTTASEDIQEVTPDKPGAELAKLRKQKGFSIEYVANKLHLRVNIIELLEADNYDRMPEPVFIRGYLRAYAKLLDVCPDKLVETFKAIYSTDHNIERTLWQSKRQSNQAERVIRWVTGIFVVGVFISVAVWWYNNKDNEKLFSSAISKSNIRNTSDTEIRLTDLSKMRSILSSNSAYNKTEKNSSE